MTDFRNTNSIAEVLADNSPFFRQTLILPEIFGDMNPNARFTLVFGELLYDTNPFFRDSLLFAELLMDLDPKLRMTQEQVEVVGKFSTVPPLADLLPERWEFLWPRYEVAEYGERWNHA